MARGAVALFALVVIGQDYVRVSVIIPTHNESHAIGRVLADLPPDLVTEVIVVDSNSSDGTPEIAAEAGARVIHEPRRGYGRACLTGLAAANNPDMVVFLDGDYSDRPSELPILLAPIIEGHADITLGSRLHDGRSAGALPWHPALGDRFAATLIRILYGVEITDLGPFRAGRADVLHALSLEQATYGWAVEMILKGALAGYRVVEVPVSYYPRIGKSKISGTVKGTLGAGWFILSLIVRYYFRHRTTGLRGQHEVDPGFINDNYWALFPLHAYWDKSASVIDQGMFNLPQGSGMAELVPVKYPADSGYTPGDTWDLYVGKDSRVVYFVYHRGGAKPPSRVLATWAGYKQAGPLLFSTEHRGSADGKPFRLVISDVAVKLTGSDTWIKAQ